MNPIHILIHRIRARPDVEVIDQRESWKLVIPKGPKYLCEVTVPHSVPEWFASVLDRTTGEEVWSDWMDYEGYDDASRFELMQTMADDVTAFMGDVSTRKLTLPLSISGAEERVQDSGSEA